MCVRDVLVVAIKSKLSGETEVIKPANGHECRLPSCSTRNSRS